jgi:hypothetical protein
MTDLASNPIYNRMVQGSFGPSPLICLLIALGIAITGNAFWPMTSHWPFNNDPFNVLYSVLPGVIAVIIIFSSWNQMIFVLLALFFSAGMAARLVSTKEFTLIRSSGLSEEEIVRGYTEGLCVRYRLWRNISLGFAASGLVLYSMGVNYLFSGFYGFGIVGMYISAGAILISYYFVIWPMLITAGMWAALRNPANAGALAIGFMLIAVFYAFIADKILQSGAFGLYEMLSQFGSNYWIMGMEFTKLVAILGLPYLALRYLRADCIRLIEHMA